MMVYLPVRRKSWRGMYKSKLACHRALKEQGAIIFSLSGGVCAEFSVNSFWCLSVTDAWLLSRHFSG